MSETLTIDTLTIDTLPTHFVPIARRIRRHGFDAWDYSIKDENAPFAVVSARAGGYIITAQRRDPETGQMQLLGKRA